MLLRQLSNAIKTQHKAPKVPYLGHFLPFALQGKDLLSALIKSLWQKIVVDLNMF